MTENKKHGRRRAVTPKRRSKQIQNFGTILLTGSMLVTVASPALAVDEQSNSKNPDVSSQSVIDAASEFLSMAMTHEPITADPNAKIQFVMTAVKSEAGPATKLKKELEEKAVKDAEAAAYAAKVSAEAAAKKPAGSTGVNKLEAAGFKASSSSSSTPVPLTPTKLLSAPLKIMTPSSPFGQRISPITGQKDEFHRGQDYSVRCGTDVLAAAGGTVIYTQWHPYGGGNRVEIDHGNGLITTYNHLEASKVKVGQKVERGDVIAASGTTGASTGCHLHFEVEVNNDVVDPLPWL